MNTQPSNSSSVEMASISQELPALGTSTKKGINKRAMVALGVIALLGLVIAAFFMSKASGSKAAKQKKLNVEEVLNVPERPVALPSLDNTEPIGLASDKSKNKDKTDVFGAKNSADSKDSKDGKNDIFSASQPTDPNAPKVETLAQKRANSGVYGTANNTSVPSGSSSANSNGVSTGAINVDPNSPNAVNRQETAIEEAKNLMRRRAGESGSVGDVMNGNPIGRGGSGGGITNSNFVTPDPVVSKPTQVLTPDTSSSAGQKQTGKGSANDEANGKRSSTAFPVSVSRNIPLSPDYFIPQGSAIRCVMNNRIISDFQGMTICSVAENILSFSAKKILVPKGSRIIGDYKRSSLESLDRVSIIWSRIITPDNIDIALYSAGTDSLGSAGVPGIVDEKWRYRLGTALLVTLGGDLLKLATIKYGPTTTEEVIEGGKTTRKEVPFESETVKTVVGANRAFLAQLVNVPTSIIVQQGTVVSILVEKDLDFSNVYEKSEKK